MSQENVEIVKRMLAAFHPVDGALRHGQITRMKLCLDAGAALAAAGLRERRP